MSVLVKWNGPGILSVRDVTGKSQDLKPGESCRIPAINNAQRRAGLREVGELGAAAVVQDVDRALVDELRAALADQGRELDGLREEFERVVDQREEIARLLDDADGRIGALEGQLAERDERIVGLQGQVAASELVDKPWLDATVPVLKALVERLGGDLGKNARRSDYLAWLYAKPQRPIAAAFETSEGGDA